MERRLIVMRHAKSSWDSGATSDHARPLNGRGKRDAPRVAAHLAKLGWQPQHILCSDAERTRETCCLLLAEWESGIGVDYLGGLYLAGPRELTDELLAVSAEVETLLVVGHNPGWEAIVYRLSQQSIPLKTGTAVLLSAEDCAEWGEAFRATWTLHDVIYPRELDG